MPLFIGYQNYNFFKKISSPSPCGPLQVSLLFFDKHFNFLVLDSFDFYFFLFWFIVNVLSFLNSHFWFCLWSSSSSSKLIFIFIFNSGEEKMCLLLLFKRCVRFWVRSSEISRANCLPLRTNPISFQNSENSENPI